VQFRALFSVLQAKTIARKAAKTRITRHVCFGNIGKNPAERLAAALSNSIARSPGFMPENSVDKKFKFGRKKV
jgi:hypothetical protein